MTAELLRQAADRLDELAGAATPEPWRYMASGWGNGSHSCYAKDATNLTLTIESSDDVAARPEGALVAALVSPELARALAAWLRDSALSFATAHPRDRHHALAVARAVLGEADLGEGRGGAVSEGEE